MKNNRKRRNFLKGSLLASTGAVLLPTTNLWAIKSFSPHSKSLADIRTKLFGKQVEVSGQIFDAFGKNTVNNAKIEFWHLTPNSEEYNHRSHVLTDLNGNFKILTDFPNREFGKHTTIHFRVSKDNQETHTQLKFSDVAAFITDRHWESNRNLEDHLLFPQLEKSVYKTKINFNISINQ